MRKLTLLLIFLIFFGCLTNLGCVTNSKTQLNKNPGNRTAKTVLSRIKEYLCPFDGYSYSNVSVKINGSYIYVRAKCSKLEGEDDYLFVNDNGILILKSYCLEALPGNVKADAIAVAMSNRIVAENASGIVTVRRILPQMSAKFYKPKVLFSVTWHGSKVVSALVDLDRGRVVRVWTS